MTAGLFARLAMTHVGPLTESPVSAKAASVPNAAVRFWMKPAPSFSSIVGEVAFEVRLRPGDLRGELLEQLQWLARRHVAGEEGIGRQIFRRAPGAGVSQPRPHSRSRPLERERDLVLFRSRRGTLLEEEVLHPDHAGELDWRGIVSGRHRDQRGRIHADQPAHAALVPLADGCRKRGARALPQMSERPRQVRRRV